MGGTGGPLGKTFFLHRQRRHPELRKIPTYLPREVNEKTLNHSGYIPKLELTLEKKASSGYHIKIDKRSGFCHVDLTHNAQKILAFITPQGKVFTGKVMHFGRPNTAALFQELMNTMLSVLC